MNNVFISGEKVYLRAYEPGDEVVYAMIENHPESRATLFYAFPVATGQIKDKAIKFSSDPNIVNFTICRKDEERAIGQTALVRIDWPGRMATFYIGIADKNDRSGGFGTETVKLVTDYAFNTLNFNRVQLHVAVKNEAAVKVYKRCGFVQEGTLREAMYSEGKYHNFYVMGLLKSDWQKLQE